MNTKVLDTLKPEVASLGFNDKEIGEIAESISASLAEDASDEDVKKSVNAVLPFLKVSQSAANRSFERFKTQFEKDHQSSEEEKAKKAAEEAARKKAEEEEAARKKAEEEAKKGEPDWFKAYRENAEKQREEDRKAREELQKKLAGYESARANEGFVAKVKAQLKEKGVDENYYGLLLKGRTFDSDEKVTEFVTEVTESWGAFVKAKGIEELVKVTPPGGGKTPPKEASAEVKARIERKKKQASSVDSPLKGLDTNK